MNLSYSVYYNQLFIFFFFDRWVIEAMKIILQMQGKSTNSLENHSPYEVRQLLQKVLSVREWAVNEQ